MSKSKNKQYAFNINREEWILNDVQLVLEQIEENDKIKTIFIGTPKFVTHKNYFDIDDIIENMKERAYDESKYDDNYLSDMTDDHKVKLTKLILDYLHKHIKSPNFFELTNIKEVSVTKFKKLYRSK